MESKVKLEPLAPVTEAAVSVPETLKPFLEWAIGLAGDEQGWISIPATFETLLERVRTAYPEELDLTKFPISLQQLGAVDIQIFKELFKLTNLVRDKLTETATDEPETIDQDVYSRSQQQMTTTGSKYFENGVIDIRTICQYFKFKGFRLGAEDVRFYCDELVSDGLGEWVLTDTQKFRLYFLSPENTN